MTLALPKLGLIQDNAKECVGRLYVADISVPPDLYKEIGYESQYLFSDSSIVKVN
jgi:hypothetical protein